MDAKNIEREFQRKAAQLEAYMRMEAPRMVRRKVLRFIDGNFRAQGWQGVLFQRWKESVRKGKRTGSTLIQTGRLRRSFHGDTSPFETRIWSDAPYARVHNRGFNGKVSVKAHTRYKYAKTQVGTGRLNKNGTERKKTVHVIADMTQVQAHQRQMNIPKRQFAPEDVDDSPVLFNSIRREMINGIKNIFEH